VDAEVELVRVDARVVHADVGEQAAGHDRPDAEAAQQESEIGGEERAVAALADEMLARPRPQPLDELGARGALDAVLGLVAVELAAGLLLAELTQRAMILPGERISRLVIER